MAKKPSNDYRDAFSETGFWQKLRRYARQAGIKGVYTALLLFYAYRRKDTPTWAKSVILGALGYLIAPIDALPDLTPILGYTDDLGVLSFSLVTIASFINKQVKEQARAQLTAWFGEYEEEEIELVDKQL